MAKETKTIKIKVSARDMIKALNRMSDEMEVLRDGLKRLYPHNAAWHDEPFTTEAEINAGTYERAAQYILYARQHLDYGNKPMMLVHGYHRLGGRAPIACAWVEIEGKNVLDFRKAFKATLSTFADYRKAHSIIGNECIRYTPAEVVRMVDASGHHGPWPCSDIEKQAMKKLLPWQS